MSDILSGTCTVQKLLIMMVVAGFTFSIFLFGLSTTAITTNTQRIENIQDDVAEISDDVSYLRGQFDAYWPEKKP